MSEQLKKYWTGTRYDINAIYADLDPTKPVGSLENTFAAFFGGGDGEPEDAHNRDENAAAEPELVRLARAENAKL